METHKAIILIKSYIQYYSLNERLYSIGLDPDNYNADYIDVFNAFFGFEDKLIDEYAEIFYKASENLIDCHDFGQGKLPDDKLSETAIEIYSGWTALKFQQTAKA